MKLLKSFVILSLVFVYGYLRPITCFATFDIYNNSYTGVYENTYKDRSYIEINKAGYCNVNLVFSPLEKKYISASYGEGYINQTEFQAEFSKYVIRSSDGSYVESVQQETYFEGSVTRKLFSYTRIEIGGHIYEKS